MVTNGKIWKLSPMYPNAALTNNIEKYIFKNFLLVGLFLKVKKELQKKLNTTATLKATEFAKVCEEIFSKPKKTIKWIPVLITPIIP